MIKTLLVYCYSEIIKSKVDIVNLLHPFTPSDVHEATWNLYETRKKKKINPANKESAKSAIFLGCKLFLSLLPKELGNQQLQNASEPKKSSSHQSLTVHRLWNNEHLSWLTFSAWSQWWLPLEKKKKPCCRILGLYAGSGPLAKSGSRTRDKRLQGQKQRIS